MREQFLFVVMPYFAAGSFLTASVVRCLLERRTPERVPKPAAADDRIAAIWRWAIGIVAAGHLLAFAFPDFILLWNRQPFRLLLLEGSGLCAGTLALIAVVWTRARRGEAARLHAAVRACRVVASTLVFIAVGSGVTTAAIDRWGSAWSVVTLGPYLSSLLRLAPSTATVQGLPFPARVHVFSAFALFAIWPFGGEAGFVVLSLDALTRRVGARSANVLRRASRTAAEWTVRRAQPLTALVLPNDAEDN
jgi:nitrate reductase gamma subunit